MDAHFHGGLWLGGLSLWFDFLDCDSEAFHNIIISKLAQAKVSRCDCFVCVLGIDGGLLMEVIGQCGFEVIIEIDSFIRW